jgi:hypothetical protein
MGTEDSALVCNVWYADVLRVDDNVIDVCLPCDTGSQRNLHKDCNLCDPHLEYNSAEVCLSAQNIPLPSNCTACAPCAAGSYARLCEKGVTQCRQCTQCTPGEVRASVWSVAPVVGLCTPSDVSSSDNVLSWCIQT